MTTITAKDGTQIVYKDWGKGQPHGMPTVHADQINADLLAFVQRSQQATA
jgi:non-heme chloroperoxidase